MDDFVTPEVAAATAVAPAGAPAIVVVKEMDTALQWIGFDNAPTRA